MSNHVAHKIRTRARLSQSAAAALAAVSPTTWRLFEASADAISPEKRAACEAALERMAALAG